MTFNPEL